MTKDVRHDGLAGPEFHRAATALAGRVAWFYTYILLGLAVFLCAIAAPIAQARDLIDNRSYYEDASGLMTFAEVQNRPTKPFNGVLTKGFGPSALWLRLHVSAPTTSLALAPEKIALRIRPAFLDDVRLFDPKAGGFVGAAGDRVTRGADTMHVASFVFFIATPRESRDVWVRVESTSTRSISIDALSVADLIEIENRDTLFVGAYLGVVLFLLIWSFILWLRGREKIIGAFTLKQTFACLFGVSVLGWLRLALPDSTPLWVIDNATSLLGIFTVTTSILFEINFVSEFDPPVWTKYVLRGLLVLLPIELTLIGFGKVPLALSINMAQILIVPPVVLFAVVMARGWRAQNPDARPALPRWIVLANYIMLVALLASGGALGLGFVGGFEASLHIPLIYGLITGLMILLLLQYRTSVMVRRQITLTTRLIDVQLDGDRERQHREENEKLLAIIAHEMRTPMSSLRLITGLKAPTPEAIAQAHQAVRDMNDIIERCAHTEQLDGRRISAVATTFALAPVLENIVARSTRRKDIQCDVPHLEPLRSDEQVLRIILGNIIDNACKYGAFEQPIEISVSASRKFNRDGIAITIANPPGDGRWPDASRMFEKYYRSPSSRGVTGSGLGLYLVANLTRILQGDVVYQPDERSIRFVLWFPMDLVA